MKKALAMILAALLCVSGNLSAFTAAAADTGSKTQDALYEVFENPPIESKSRPLWFWNEEIVNMSDEMLEEMTEKSFLESGYSGFVILPQLSTGYLSEEYFNKYEVVLKKARELGMKLTLYDENWFPSYKAGGVLAQEYPDYTAQRLEKVEKNVTGPAQVTFNFSEGTYMGAVKMNNATKERYVVDEPLAPIFTLIPGVYASSEHGQDYKAEKAFDGNANTRWNAGGASNGNQWLEVCYEEPTTFDSIKVKEFSSRIADYSVQYWRNDEWVICAEGTGIGDGVTKDITFDAVTSQRVRFYIHTLDPELPIASRSASLWLMEVYNANSLLSVPQELVPGIYGSSSYSSAYLPENAFDGNPDTRWNSAANSYGNQWLELCYESPRTFDTVRITEAEVSRIGNYSIQYWADGKWKTCASGTGIGAEVTKDITFDAVTSRRVRFYIHTLSAGNSITVRRMEVYNNDSPLSLPQTLVPGVYASSEHDQNYTVEKAFDGNAATRWNSRAGNGENQWLEICYEAPKTFDTVRIKEARVSSLIADYSVQYWDEGEWKTCASGTGIGADVTKDITFDAVTSQKVRFYIHTSSVPAQSVSVYLMEVYNAGSKLPVPTAGDNPIHGASFLLSTDVPAGDWKVMLFMCVKDSSNGVNYLDGDSVDKYIEVTHQRYYDRFPEYFGTVFDSTFYDEPTMSLAAQERMWTPKFNQKFEAKYGYSPVLLYPAMFYDVGAETEGARAAMNAMCAELYATQYIGKLTEWCHDHGIFMSSGHQFDEEGESHVKYSGDLMKTFKYQDMPGVDYIFRYGLNQKSCKIVSSAAFNWDKGKVMTETYGGAGEAMGIDNLYRFAMDQYVKGVSFMIPHAIWSDTNPAKIPYPPELSYRSTVYGPELPRYNEYIGRVQMLLQDGRHVADIGVLYPVDYHQSAFWINNNSLCNPPGNNYMEVGQSIADNIRRDYTFVHPERLDECEVAGDTLHMPNLINYEDYKVFVLPGTQIISLSNAEKIKEFFEAGGKLISVGQLPYKATRLADNDAVAAIISEIFGISDLANSTGATGKNSNTNGGLAIKLGNLNDTELEAALDEALAVYDVEFTGVPSISDGYFSYIHKVKDGTDLYYLANSSLTREINATVDLRGEFEPYAWDPHTGTRTALQYTYEVIDGVTVTRVHFNLPPVYSMFIVDDDITSQQFKGITVSADTEYVGIGDFVEISGYKKTAKLSVHGITEDDKTVPVAGSQVSFENLNPNIAEVDSFGVVSGIMPGTAEIKVRFGAYEGAISVRVENITLDAIELESDRALLKTGSAGSAAYLAVTGRLSDGEKMDISNIAGLAYVQSTPELLELDGLTVSKAAGAPDAFSVLLHAILTLDGKTVNSNDILINALPLKNIALSANGGIASASSQYSNNFAASSVITGDRTGRSWGNGGGWNNGAGGFPQWLQVAFDGGKKLIDEVNLYNLQDNYQNGVDPDPWMTFMANGLVDFEVQYHDGTDFVTLPDASFKGNNIVWNRIRFDPVETDRIRVFVTFGLASYARIIELEAWEADRVSVDKSALLEAYNKYKDYEETAYQPDNWKIFSDALNDAKDLLINSNASQEDIIQATSALVSAGESLVKNYTAADIAAGITSESVTAPAADDTQLLLPEVPEGFEISLASSSDPSVIALDGTITPPDAETTVKIKFTVSKTGSDDTAETEEITIIVPANTGVALVDKTALEILIANTNALDQAEYTPETWSDFADALAEAENVFADDDADQDRVNSAYADLDAAMKALVKIDGGEDVEVTKIKIDASGLFTLSIKKKAQIPVIIEPDEATDRSVTWISTNTNIFTVDEHGNITPKKQGTATLTAVSSNGLKSTIIVRITA